MEKVTAFLNRKVGGIKVLYFALIFALIVGWYAWRLVRNGAIDGATAEDSGGDSGGGESASTGALPNLESGTVYVATQPDYVADTDVETNDSWAAKVIKWIAGENIGTSLEAQAAVQKYLAGADLSWKQGQIIDQAIGKYGTPPTLLDVGNVADKAIAKKVPDAPGAPAVHTIRKDSARLSVIPPNDNGAPILQYEFQWSGDATFNGADRTFVAAGREATIPLGYPDKEYRARVRAKNAQGWGAYGPAAIFKTAKG